MPMPRLCGGTRLIGRPVEQDLAVRRRLEARQHHQRGRLARARRPEQRQELALGDVEVEVLDDQRFAVIALLDVDEPDHRSPPSVAAAMLPRPSPGFLFWLLGGS